MRVRPSGITWAIITLCLHTAGCVGPSADRPRTRGSVSVAESAASLQDLIDRARDGETVVVPRGRYVLNRSLLIQGRHNLVVEFESGAQVLVRDVEAHVVRIANSSNIEIRDAYLRHLKPLPDYQCHGYVVSIEGGRKVSIINCELDGCGAIGVEASRTSDLTIRNCYIHNNTFNALYFHTCNQIRIHSSIIEDNANLLQMYEVDDIEMSDNLIRRNGGYWRPRDLDPGLTE